jgi:hypothetical protein
MVTEPDDLLEPRPAERIGIGQVRDADLDVHAVLRRQAPHRRRADVVDAHGALPENRPDPAREPREVALPPLGVRLDRDARHRLQRARKEKRPRGSWGRSRT